MTRQEAENAIASERRLRTVIAFSILLPVNYALLQGWISVSIYLVGGCLDFMPQMTPHVLETGALISACVLAPGMVAVMASYWITLLVLGVLGLSRAYERVRDMFDPGERT